MNKMKALKSPSTPSESLSGRLYSSFFGTLLISALGSTTPGFAQGVPSGPTPSLLSPNSSSATVRVGLLPDVVFAAEYGAEPTQSSPALRLEMRETTGGVIRRLLETQSARWMATSGIRSLVSQQRGRETLTADQGLLSTEVRLSLSGENFPQQPIILRQNQPGTWEGRSEPETLSSSVVTLVQDTSLATTPCRVSLSRYYRFKVERLEGLTTTALTPQSVRTFVGLAYEARFTENCGTQLSGISTNPEALTQALATSAGTSVSDPTESPSPTQPGSNPSAVTDPESEDYIPSPGTAPQEPRLLGERVQDIASRFVGLVTTGMATDGQPLLRTQAIQRLSSLTMQINFRLLPQIQH
jgi:hypothetical protein